MSMWRHDRTFSTIFCAWDYRSGPIFRRRSQCDVKTPSDSIFEAGPTMCLKIFTEKDFRKRRNIDNHLRRARASIANCRTFIPLFSQRECERDKSSAVGNRCSRTFQRTNMYES